MNEDQKAREWRELKAAEAAFFQSLQFLSERVRRARRESLVCRAHFWEVASLLALTLIYCYFVSR